MKGAPGAADDAALEALDFPAVVKRVAECATCAPGMSKVRALRPFGRRDDASAELALVDDAIAFLQAGGTIGFAGVTDLTEAIARAELGGSLSGEELARIAGAETALVAEIDSLREHPDGPLRGLIQRAADMRSLIRAVTDAIDRDGSVKDDASVELAKLRRRQKALRDEIRERCTTIVRNPNTAKFLSEPVVTIRAGRYVVGVRKEFVGQVPGVVHDESASGATAFVEPLATVQTNNELRGSEAAEAREVARILGVLSGNVGAHADALRSNAALLAHLDSLGARARWAVSVRGGIPQLRSDPTVRIVNGRHPLLRHEPVPLDVTLGEAFDVLVISGPNMGGKSVALKTIGLFCALAYSGIPVPAAAGTHIGWFDRIACVLGDEQSISADLSSFSAHLQALRAAMSGPDGRQLILVDEIGGGTEPNAGAAIAQAFIESVKASGARVAVTTHFTQLKVFAAQTERVANASMLFDARTNQPTYVLAIGVPGQSLALRLARALGMDEPMIARAESLLGVEARKLEDAFESLARERGELQRRQAELQSRIAITEKLGAELRERVAKLDNDRKRFEERASAALEKAVRDLRDELAEQARLSGETARRQSRRIPSAEKTLAETMRDIRRSLGLEPPEPGRPSTAQLREGDPVFVRSFGSHGTVSAIFDRDVLVTIGNVRTVVAKSDVALDRTTSANARTKQKEPIARPPTLVPLQDSVATEVDVRGMRVDEALPMVDKALDSASLAGAAELRIIHGKGTGQLGRGINAFLRGHAQVDSTRTAADREGGSGVTVVTLK